MKTPRVTVHYAQTLDGRIATRSGQSQWISCEETLTLQHRLRAEHDAVMVGVGTVLSDNPRLTVRHVEGPSPLRVVVDSTLRLPLDCALLRESPHRTLLATTVRAPVERADAVRARGAEVLLVAANADGRVALPDLLAQLALRGVRSVLVEGGQGLITTTFAEGLLDRLIVCIAPKLMGSGIDAVGDLHITEMSHALTFTHSAFSMVGTDIIFDGTIERGAAGA